MKIWTNSACPHSYFILWRFHLHLRELHIRIDRVCAFTTAEFSWEIRLKMRISLSIPLACCSRSFVSFWWMKNDFSALRSSRSTATCRWGIVSETNEFSAFIHAIYGRRRLIRMAAEQLVNRQAQRKFHSQFTKEMCHSISDELSRIFSIDD